MSEWTDIGAFLLFKNTLAEHIDNNDTRGLTFVTAQGDTYSFWFDKRRFEGVDGRCYVLSGDEKLWELVWGIRATDPDYQDLMR